MANIWIEGHGVFTLGNEKVQDLVCWLATNQAVQAEGKSEHFDGQQLLNETGEEAPPQKGASVGNNTPKQNPDGTGTYEFGGTWI